jgi:hypothetical protein
MTRTLAALVETYEAAAGTYEGCEPQTRDWGGTFAKAGAEKLTRALADAEGVLVETLRRVGPVVHRGRDYRVIPSASEPAGRLLIGPAAQDAAGVLVP